MLDQKDAMRLGEALGAFRTSVTSCLTLLCIGTDAANAAAEAIFPSEIQVETRNTVWHLRATPSYNYDRLELQVACDYGTDLRDFSSRLELDYSATDLVKGTYDPKKGSEGFSCQLFLPVTAAHTAYHTTQEQAAGA